MNTSANGAEEKVALLEMNPIAQRLTGTGVPEPGIPQSRMAFWPIADQDESYRVFAATGISLRTRAYRLAMDLYRKFGFATDSTELLVGPYDHRAGTLVLLAEDENGRDAATMTIVSDSTEAGLPADKIFHAELEQLRGEGRRLAEGVRLAIADEHLFSQELFIEMINLLYIHGRFNRKATDLLVEVNPRHVAYYQRLFGFEPLGRQRPCPRVNGAPARLMRLKTQAPDAPGRIGTGQRAAPTVKFYSPKKELEALRFIRRGHRPMSAFEHAYFSNKSSRPSRQRVIASCEAKN